MERYRHLEGYEFSGCAVRRWNILSFFGTKWEDKDALETRPTGIFFYYPDDPPAKRWAYRGIGDTTGIHGAPAFLPDERWVFVMDDGEVYAVGGGYDDWEERVTPKKPTYFSRARNIGNGYVYAVGVNRTVFRRNAKDQWVSLERGLPKKSAKGDPGFDDISGFSDKELYACGGDGDLWMFDGRAWSQIDLPTNAALWRITCGEDGLAYILTEQRAVIVGRGDSWRILEQDVTKSILEELVWFQDRIYVSTVDELFEIVDGAFVPTRLKPPEQNSYAHLAAGDGVLLVAGANEACMYDGKRWTRILEAAPE